MFNKNNPLAKGSETPAVRSGRAAGTGNASADSQVSTREPALAPGFGQGLNSLGSRREESPASSNGRIIVGGGVKLKGAEIADCDMLIVEGEVEGLMSSGGLRIGDTGRFKGTVTVDVAEVQGVFEGELTARKQLVIKANGRVSGKTRYGKLTIEEGGQIAGDIGTVDAAASNRESVPAPSESGQTES